MQTKKISLYQNVNKVQVDICQTQWTLVLKHILSSKKSKRKNAEAEDETRASAPNFLKKSLGTRIPKRLTCECFLHQLMRVKSSMSMFQKKLHQSYLHQEYLHQSYLYHRYLHQIQFKRLQRQWFHMHSKLFHQSC